MKEEVVRILKMVEEGKISSEKAAELIAVLGNNKEELMVKRNDKMIKIKVLSKDNDSVNVTIPVRLVQAVGGAISKLPPIKEIEGLDIDIQDIIQIILDSVSSDIEGRLVDVKSAQGDIVEIVIE
ncbi:hypothetical protein [Clostridium sp. OS1-26]|uniref:SHOCT-like domain-containing protein n=1 Tax=Clostridium sp. OS1-26 TaxID=3070681 RepID=UPI0027DFB3C8|nr:hypothetical protein [Clostridium sp. OS1-26]WML34584.1 hypothetical protein RCG18_25465 [Clostridium sp. OS1-26]